MATSKNQWETAHQLLSQFERELIEPSLFKWDYFVEKVGASKQTFLRNKEFINEFKRVRTLVKKYKKSNIGYSLERSQKSKNDQEIEALKSRIKEIEQERDRAREQISYAVLIARRNNIDPDLFIEASPLLRSQSLVKEISRSSMENNSVVTKLRAKKKNPQLILIRGLPGSGKSTMAKKLENFEHFETDMFFVEHGKYQFNKDLLTEAHNWCKKMTHQALSEGINVVVSNTFITKNELTPYFEMAKTLNAKCEVRVAKGAWDNIHGLSEKEVNEMRGKWEIE
jgi:tRNA uridine 5-carbamoylmethylation protein Kti12